MENAVDAFKMAFAVFVFVFAMTIAFAVFSQAREVSDTILYMNDKTNFEEYVLSSSDIRTVGIETVISSVKRYVTDNENYRVTIIDGAKTYEFDLLIDQDKNRTPKQIEENLQKSLAELIEKYSDDLFEETYREWIYRGDIKEYEDGETVEKVNTDTKVEIIYTKKQRR